MSEVKDRKCLDCPVRFPLGVGQGPKKRCDACQAVYRRTHQKEKRQAAALMGMCARCTGRPAVEGQKCCAECKAINDATPSRAAKRARGKQQRAGQRTAKQRANDMKLRRRWGNSTYVPLRDEDDADWPVPL